MRVSISKWPSTGSGIVKAVLVALQTPYALLAFVSLSILAPTWVFLHDYGLCLLISAGVCLGAVCFALDKRKRFVSQRRVPVSVWLAAIMLSGLMAAGGLREAGRTSVHGITHYDQGRYVGAVFACQRLGWPAPTCTLATMLNGRYREDKQHPAYLWLLSTFMRDDMRYFYIAQIVTLAVGCLVPAVACVLVARVYGAAVGVLTGLLLAVNRTLIRHCCLLNCEGLLVLCALLSWYSALRGFGAVGPRRAGRLPGRSQSVAFLCAGAFAGLAWLVKGSGAFLVVAFVCACLSAYGRATAKRPAFWLYFAGFIAVASPLMTRNVVVYGWPLHNWNTPRMWLDGWREANAWGADTSGLGPLFLLERHGFGGVWRRLCTGVRDEFWCLREGVSIRLPLRMAVRGRVVLGVAIMALVLDPHRDRRVFQISCLAVFFAFFSWFNIDRSGRYTLPVLHILYAGFAAASVGAIRRLAPVRLRRHVSSSVVIACLAVALALTLRLCGPVHTRFGVRWPIRTVFRHWQAAPDAPLSEHIVDMNRRAPQGRGVRR